MWDYSELSAEARKLGGPNALRAAYIQLGRRLGQQLSQRRAFILGALTVGVPVAGWKVLKDYRDRRAVAASQATVVTSEAAPATATEEAVVAEAEAVLTAVEAAPVVDESEPAAESAPSATAAQSTPAAGRHFSA